MHLLKTAGAHRARRELASVLRIFLSSFLLAIVIVSVTAWSLEGPRGGRLVDAVVSHSSPTTLTGKVATLLTPRLREYAKGEKFATVCNIFLLAGLCFSFLVVAARHELIEEVRFRLSSRREMISAGPWRGIVPHPRKFLLLALCLFSTFFALYAAVGYRLASSAAFFQGNFFEFDPYRIISNITDPSTVGIGMGVHPLYRLLLNPLGSLLSAFGVPPLPCVVFIDSLLGALAAVLAFLFFWITSHGQTGSFLVSLLFPLSMSQLLVSTFPETGPLAACSLIVTYLLFWLTLQMEQIPIVWWTVAGVLSFGVTTANVVQTVLCLAVAAAALERKRPRRPQWPQVLLVLMGLLALATVLSILQKWAYPSYPLFFLPSTYLDVFPFFYVSVLRDPFLVIPEVVKQVMIVTLMGPMPRTVTSASVGGLGLSFFRSSDYSALGWLGVLMMVVGLVGGAVRLWACRDERPFLLGICLCLLFNLGFHSFYGASEGGRLELMVYSGDYAFLVLAFLTGFARSKGSLVRTYLLALIVIAAVNNLAVLRHIVRICTAMRS